MPLIRQQKTISRGFTLEGHGLHTGNGVRIAFKPAPVDSGIKFVRVDLDPPVEVAANVTSIPESARTNRNTTIGTGAAAIHTVEHILATCYALGVDNLIIEIDSNEPPEPVAGNYAEFVRAFRDAGFTNQGSPASLFRLEHAVTWQHDDIELLAVPSDTFRISFTIKYEDPVIGTQYRTIAITPDNFATEIAPARTFVLMEDVEQLRKMGLIKGGSLDTALVFDNSKVVSSEPLRFPDECVRHKILDLVGDLSLLGVPLQAHVHAVCSGHAGNIAFVREVRKSWLQNKRRAAAAEAGRWDINLILDIMPHRYPFLLVDRIIDLEDRKRVVGIKNVTMNEPFFTGHFPGHPIMPAVLIIEAMAQTGGVLLLNTVDDPRRYLVYFTRVDKAKFRRPVIPGDQLRFELELVSLRRGMCTMTGRAFVEGALAAEAELSSVIVER